MFRAVLYVQWKWARLLVLVASFAVFALPLYSVQGVALVGAGKLTPTEFLDGHAAFGALYPLAAGLVALLIGLSAWAADHAGRHVYALSLPVPRWHFVLMRLGAGLVLLAVPTLALWFGALLSAAGTALPIGLQSYPTLLTLRFALAALISFGLFFAISSGTTRTAGWILGGLLAWVLAQLLLNAVGVKTDIVSPLLDRLTTWPGPFDVFTGRWVLLDV